LPHEKVLSGHSRENGNPEPTMKKSGFLLSREWQTNIDDPIKSLLERHLGESRGPEHLEKTRHNG
jgi:hypothetical protein